MPIIFASRSDGVRPGNEPTGVARNRTVMSAAQADAKMLGLAIFQRDAEECSMFIVRS
jgi:hypothetical protein